MKPWYKSRTIWFNLVTGTVTLAAVGLEFYDQLGLDASSTAILGMVLTSVTSLGNLWLRSVTVEGVSK